MDRKSKQGFVLSAALHGSVVALAVILPMIDLSDRDKPTEFILVPVPPLSGPVGSGSDDAPVSDRQFDFSGPDRPKTSNERKPQPPQPKPAPEPKPTPPSTKPAPPKPTPTKTPPKPAANEKPKPALSYEDFVKQHGPPKTPTKKPVPPTGASSGRRKGPRIDTDFSGVVKESVVGGSPYGSLTGTQITELGMYVAGLRAALESAWPKPPGLSNSLATVVEFSVSADGRISNVRITSSSGNPVFDSSVVDAFEMVGRVDPPPDGKAQRFRLTFKMNDD